MKWSNQSLHRPRTSRGRRNPTSRLPQVRPLLFGRELRFHFSSCCQLTAAASLQLPEVFRSALSDLLPTFPSKLDGGGIFLLRQNSEGLALRWRRLTACWELLTQSLCPSPRLEFRAD